MTSLKEKIQNAYTKIVSEPKDECSCSTGCNITDEYAQLNGHVEDADYQLGCGLPTQFSNIKTGNTVLDLGSGAGNDVFVARQLAGDNGKIIGIDFTPAMVDKANINKQKLGYTNVEFLLGDIENIPLANNSVDVVVSNCVMNLVPNKNNGYSEIFRVLKPNGHFSISDMVFTGNFNEQSLEKVFEMYGGCVSGAINIKTYTEIILKCGFTDLQIHRKQKINFTDEQLAEFLSPQEIKEFLNPGNEILSIQLIANKK